MSTDIPKKSLTEITDKNVIVTNITVAYWLHKVTYKMVPLKYFFIRCFHFSKHFKNTIWENEINYSFGFNFEIKSFDCIYPFTHTSPSTQMSNTNCSKASKFQTRFLLVFSYWWKTLEHFFTDLKFIIIEMTLGCHFVWPDRIWNTVFIWPLSHLLVALDFYLRDY